MSPLALRPLMLMLAGLTSGATMLKVLTLATPLPEQDGPVNVHLPGYNVDSLVSRPGQRGYNLSHGTMRRFRLRPVGGAPGLGLTLVTVRSRNRDGLKLSSVTPELALTDQQLRVAKKEGLVASAPVEELAFGRSPKYPQGAITRLQTCVTLGGSSGVTHDTLALRFFRERDPTSGFSPWIAKLLRYSGLISNTRWECLAVQLQSPVPTTPQRLQQVWKALKPTLVHTKTQ